MKQIFLLAAVLATSAGATKVGIFDINQYKDNFGSPVTMVSVPNVDKEEDSTIVFACDRDGFSLYYDTGGYPFSANYDSLATTYKFNAFAVSKTREWDMGNSHATLFVPTDLKLSFFRQAIKSTQLTLETLVGPQYGISDVQKFNFKGFAPVAAKYLKCVK